MNDMLRPALYEAWMDIQPTSINGAAATALYDVVGPVCETGDFLGKDRSLAIGQGDNLCLFSAGSYGFVMSSNYNSRPRVAEVMVDNNLADLVRGEQLLPESGQGQ
jgi:diaminopimelate decarboxylase